MRKGCFFHQTAKGLDLIRLDLLSILHFRSSSKSLWGTTKAGDEASLPLSPQAKGLIEGAVTAT